MSDRPLTTVLLTAGGLWALWLWRRHRLERVGAGPADLAGPPAGTEPEFEPAPFPKIDPGDPGVAPGPPPTVFSSLTRAKGGPI
jgi:hypothetical protein